MDQTNLTGQTQITTDTQLKHTLVGDENKPHPTLKPTETPQLFDTVCSEYDVPRFEDPDKPNQNSKPASK